MVNFSLDSRHDEVNLHRLLRRLEKSVRAPEEWSVDEQLVEGDGRDKAQIRLRAQKDIQVSDHSLCAMPIGLERL